MPAIELDPGAYGPAETEARLRLGIEPLQAYVLHDGPIVATGDVVITEHAETWTWEDGISVRLPFASVQEVHAGKVDRWWGLLRSPDADERRTRLVARTHRPGYK